MPPQATGFRYTPSSYLATTAREENRPWYHDDDNEGEAEDIGLRQEDRPAKKGTSIDYHFQSRINRSKARYRNILQGDFDPEPLEEDSELLDPLEERPATSAAAAREARQRRMAANQKANTSAPKPVVPEYVDETTRVRRLRAERLRNSLKVSSDEDEAMEQLRARRQRQLEMDRLSRQRSLEARLEAEHQAERQRLMLKEERRQLEEERKQLQQAKRLAAAELQRRKQWKGRQPPSPDNSVQDEDEAHPRRSRRHETDYSNDLFETSLFEELQSLNYSLFIRLSIDLIKMQVSDTFLDNLLNISIDLLTSNQDFAIN